MYCSIDLPVVVYGSKSSNIIFLQVEREIDKVFELYLCFGITSSASPLKNCSKSLHKSDPW